MTQEELETLGRDWQRRLRLQDWDVRYRFADRHEFSDSQVGLCQSQLRNKTAIIAVIDPGKRDEQCPWVSGWGCDTEQTLIHELLHLHFKPFAPDDWDAPAGVAMEQAIDLIACSLVEMKKQLPVLYPVLTVEKIKSEDVGQDVMVAAWNNGNG